MLVSIRGKTLVWSAMCDVLVSSLPVWIVGCLCGFGCTVLCIFLAG